MMSKLYQKTPAYDWAEAYPLGNGRLGAMVWGTPTKEITSLNHDLLWRRYIRQPQYGTAADIDQIRELCMEGKYQEAEEVLCRTFPETAKAIYINPFVPAFDLYVTMYQKEEEITEYQRSLDIEHGIASVSYKIDGTSYYREAFCDVNTGLFITHLWASKAGRLMGEVSLSRIPDCECEVTGGAGYEEVFCQGNFEEGVSFAACTKIIYRNGRLTGGKKTYGIAGENIPEKTIGLGYVFDRDKGVCADRGASVCFDSCDEIWLITEVSVDRECEDPLECCRKTVQEKRNYKEIKQEHCLKFAEIFNRTRLILEADEEHAEIAQSFDMARYLAISSGMPKEGTGKVKAPINLQGIWNRDTRPAWESDYHLDLNIQMCYWPLPAMGLTDYMEPFLCWMERLLPQARVCAGDIYGCEGASYSGCCDVWTLGGGDNVGYGALGINAWLAQILWIYYEHAPSETLLKRITAIMVEFDRFYRSMFVKKEDGTLTFPFGSSPEMNLLIGEHRQWLSSPSTFDLSTVREFYENYRKAAVLLGNPELQEECSGILKALARPVISADGVLQEWSEDHVEGEPGHRHRSPFVAFCPGTLYSKQSDPEMTAAMEKLLEKRLACGNSLSTSFSYVWDAQIMARLGRGNEAMEMMKTLLKIHKLSNFMLTTNDYDQKNGGIAWFIGTKVVQVEAQLAMAAVWSEMIYQDQQNLIRLLPALPEYMPDGTLRGIRGRRGVECQVSWKNGMLSEFSMTVKEDGIYRILPPERTAFKLCREDGSPVGCSVAEDGVWTVECKAGEKIWY